MPTFIHTADLHLGLRQYGLRERFKDMARTFMAVARMAVAEKADFILVSGDLFDSRSISPPTYMQASTVLGSLRDAGIRVFAIEGNHDQYYQRDRAGWLHSLEALGLLELVKVRPLARAGADGGAPGGGDEAGGGGAPGGCVELMGDYRECAGARIFGMRYIGASTKRELEVIAREIESVNEARGRPGMTVLMMHFGMEGQLKRDVGGEIPYGALAPLRGLVDYLALGHYHMRYEYDGWVYNPGSPEVVRMDEYGLEKGVYLHRDGETSFHPASKVLGTRPFQRVSVDLGALAKGHERSKAGGGGEPPGKMDDAGAEGPGEVGPERVVELAVRSAEAVREELASKIEEAEGAPYRVRAPSPGTDGGEAPDPGLLPVAEAQLWGRLGFPRAELDQKVLCEKVGEVLGALHVNMRIFSRADEHALVPRDVRDLTLREVENKVLTEKVLLDDRYRAHPRTVVEGLMEVKDLVMASAEPEVLLERLRGTYDAVVNREGDQPPGPGSGPKNRNGGGEGGPETLVAGPGVAVDEIGPERAVGEGPERAVGEGPERKRRTGTAREGGVSLDDFGGPK